MDGCICYGEVFNFYFIGYLNSDNIFGIIKVDCEVKFEMLINWIKNELGVFGGFCYFNDYDLWVFDIVVFDLCCVKIVLICNLVESYVSWKIVQVIG